MAGFIYIMSNPAFSNLLKIGKSKKDPTTDRVNELNQTGVPEPFKVEYYAFVEDEDYLERVIHKKFASQRPNKKREFFSVECVEAIDAIRRLSEPKSKIKYEEVFHVPPEELERFRAEQEKEAKQRADEEKKRFQAERNLRNAENRKAAEEAQQRIDAEVAKILMRRKIANWAFWLSAMLFFATIVFLGGEKAVVRPMVSGLFISGLLWVAIMPQKSPYDVDPQWAQNRPIRWFEKYLNNLVGRFLRLKK